MKSKAVGIVCALIFVIWSPCGTRAWAEESRGVARKGAEPDATDERHREEQLRRFQNALEALNSTDDTRSWLRAMRVLRAGFPASRPVLVQATRSGPRRARTFAVKLLGELGNARDDLPAVESALRDRAPSVRRTAVTAIGRLGAAGSRALQSYVEREPEARGRKLAIETMSSARSPESVSFLVRLLKKEPEEMVRDCIRGALEALSGRRFGDDVAAWEAYVERQRSRKQTELIHDYARSLQDTPSR